MAVIVRVLTLFSKYHYLLILSPCPNRENATRPSTKYAFFFLPFVGNEPKTLSY